MENQSLFHLSEEYNSYANGNLRAKSLNFCSDFPVYTVIVRRSLNTKNSSWSCAHTNFSTLDYPAMSSDPLQIPTHSGRTSYSTSSNYLLERAVSSSDGWHLDIIHPETTCSEVRIYDVSFLPSLRRHASTPARSKAYRQLPFFHCATLF